MNDFGSFLVGAGFIGFIVFLTLFLVGISKKKKIKKRLTFLIIFLVVIIGGVLITNFTEEKIDSAWYVEYETELNTTFSDEATNGDSGIIRIEIKEGKIINIFLDPGQMEKEGVTQADYDSYARAWAIELSKEKQDRKVGSDATAYIFVGDKEVSSISHNKSKGFHQK